MAFKDCISFAAANLVVINSESWQPCQGLFPSFFSLPSEVAVLFDCDPRKYPFLRQILDLDLLLCTGFNSEHLDLILSFSKSETETKE